MSDQLPVAAASNTFERIKRVNPSGAEFWSARELARVPEYLNFRNFQPVIEKAREACAKSGHAVADHFAEMRNMVGIGSGAQRELEDWALSRYACYLPTPKEHVLDHMGSLELAANLFRTTQAEDKLRRENVRHKEEANRIHQEVGRKVRRTIHELGGTMPEDLPVAESIKKVESREKKRLKASPTRLDICPARGTRGGRCYPPMPPLRGWAIYPSLAINMPLLTELKSAQFWHSTTTSRRRNWISF
jgi:DNA-damage-inducible protein D